LLQLKSAKQLSVGGYDDGGQAHRDRPHTHREIESPVDEKASSDRNSDNVIRRRPNQILDHFSIGGAGQFDRTHDIARIAPHEDDPRGLNRHIGARPDGDAMGSVLACAQIRLIGAETGEVVREIVTGDDGTLAVS